MPATPPIKHGNPAHPIEELLLERWSPRAFTPDAVADEDLRRIFTAGSWAASSYNEQPWRFVLGRKGDPIYQRILDALVDQNRGWAAAAPVLFASFAKQNFTQNGAPNKVAAHDTGAASAQIALQATALGYQVHGMAGFDAEKLSAAFGLGADYKPVACWALGKPGDPKSLPEPMQGPETSPRDRKPLAEFVFAEWNQPAL
jgi:nitroreductase